MSRSPDSPPEILRFSTPWEAQQWAKARLALADQEGLEARIREASRLVDLDLIDFIPAITQTWQGDVIERPEHLAPLCALFDRIERGERVLALVDAPPQHGKTLTIAHGLARALARRPSLPIVYACAVDKLARDKSRIVRDIAERIGVEVRDDADSVTDWLTPAGGGFRARSVGGSSIGLSAKIFVVDDPYPDRASAESALHRQFVDDWFTDVARTRTHPDSSIIFCSVRWHEDDQPARIRARSDNFEVHHFPAILPNGEPLWHRRSVEWLAEQRRESEHNWWSQWMGEPRSKGGRVFRGVQHYDRLPARYRIGKGVDFATTEKTSACFSAAVVLLESLDEDTFGSVYVVEVVRKQVETPTFRNVLRDVDSRWPGAWHWFGSTTEKGTADLVTESGVAVEYVRASNDKFNRAQPVAAAWNGVKGENGLPDEPPRVFVPRGAPWLKEFVDEIGLFSGRGDLTDDQVDALASAFEGVRYHAGKAGTVSGAGTRYEHVNGGRSFW